MCGMGDFISVSESFHFISSLDFLYYASTVASNTYIAERAKLISTLIRGLLIASVIYGTVRGPHISRRTFISTISITKYSVLRFKLLTYVTLELQNILQILSSFLFKDILECLYLYIYLLFSWADYYFSLLSIVFLIVLFSCYSLLEFVFIYSYYLFISENPSFSYLYTASSLFPYFFFTRLRYFAIAAHLLLVCCVTSYCHC